MKLKHLFPILLLDYLLVTISACGPVEELKQTSEELVTTVASLSTSTITTMQSTTVQTTTLSTTVSSSVSSSGISTLEEIITEAVTEPVVENAESVIVADEPAPVVQEEPVPIIVEEHYEEPVSEAPVELVDTEPVTELTRPEGEVLSCHGVYYNASYGAYGAMGVPLTVGYSVACNWVPLGTKLYIWNDYGYIPEGIYEVQDTGGYWGLNVDYIDFFVADGAWLSYLFARDGNIPINVVVLG